MNTPKNAWGLQKLAEYFFQIADGLKKEALRKKDKKFLRAADLHEKEGEAIIARAKKLEEIEKN